MSGGAPSSTFIVAATCFVCDDDFQTHREYNKHMFDVHHIHVVDNEPEGRSRGKHVPLEIELISDDEIEPAGKDGDGDDIAEPSTTPQSSSADGPKPALIDLTESDSESDGGWIEDEDSPDDAATKSETRESDPDHVSTCRAASKTAYQMIEESLRVAAEKRLRTCNLTDKTASAEVGTSSESSTTPLGERQEAAENNQRTSPETPRTTIAHIDQQIIEENVKTAVLSGYKSWKLMKRNSRSDMESSSLTQLLQTNVHQLKTQGAPVNDGASNATSGSSDQCISPSTADTTRVSSTVDPSSVVSDARLDSMTEKMRHGEREEIRLSANGNATGNAKPGNGKSKSALMGLLTGALVGTEEVHNFTCDICSLHFFNRTGLIEHNQDVHSRDDAEAVSLFADEEPANGLTMWDLRTSDNDVQDVLSSIGTVVDVTEKYSSGGPTEISTDVPCWPEDSTATCTSSNADLLTADQCEMHSSLRKRNLSGTPHGSGSATRSSLEGNQVEPDDDDGNTDDPLPHTKRRRRDSSDSGISLGPTLGGANQTASSRAATPVLPAFSPVEGSRGRGIPQECYVDTTRDEENLNEGDANYGLVIAEVKSLSRESLSACPADKSHNALDRTSTNACEEKLLCTGTCNERICSIPVAEKAALVGFVLMYFIKMCSREMNHIQFLAVATSLHVRSTSWLAMQYSQLRRVNSLKGGIKRVHSCSLCGIYNFRDLRFAIAHLFSKGHIEKVVEFYWINRVITSCRSELKETRGEGNSAAVNTLRSDDTPAVIDTVEEAISTSSGSYHASTSVDSSRCGVSNMDTRSEGQTLVPPQSHQHASHQYDNRVHWPNTATASQAFLAGSASHDLSGSIFSSAQSQKQFSQQTNHEAMQRTTRPPTSSAPSGSAQSYSPNEHVPAGSLSCPGRIQHPEASSQRVPSVSASYKASGSTPSYNKPRETWSSQRYPYVTTGSQMIALRSAYPGTGGIPGHELFGFQHYPAGQTSSGDMKRSHMNTESGMPQGHSGTRVQPGHELSGFQQHAAGQTSSGGIMPSHTNTASGMAQGYPGTGGRPGHEVSGFQQHAAGRVSSGGMTLSYTNTASGMARGYPGTGGRPGHELSGFQQHAAGQTSSGGITHQMNTASGMPQGYPGTRGQPRRELSGFQQHAAGQASSGGMTPSYANWYREWHRGILEHEGNLDTNCLGSNNMQQGRHIQEA